MPKTSFQRDNDVDRFYRLADSLAQEDTQTINKIVMGAKRFPNSEFLWSHRKLRIKKIELSMVLKGLRRVAEYSCDIAEVAINTNVMRSEPALSVA